MVPFNGLIDNTNTLNSFVNNGFHGLLKYNI